MCQILTCSLILPEAHLPLLTILGVALMKGPSKSWKHIINCYALIDIKSMQGPFPSHCIQGSRHLLMMKRKKLGDTYGLQITLKPYLQLENKIIIVLELKTVSRMHCVHQNSCCQDLSLILTCTVVHSAIRRNPKVRCCLPQRVERIMALVKSEVHFKSSYMNKFPVAFTCII